MRTPTLHPLALRGLLASLVIFLLGTSIVTFYRFADSATDENLFVSPPANYFVVRPIPALIFLKDHGENIQDTIPTGVYLFRVNGPTDLLSAFKDFPADTVVYVRAFTPLQRISSKLFNVRVKALRDTANYRLLENHVVVVDVTQGGASDRAGMQVLDRIVAINGQKFTNSQEADLLMRQGQSGKALDYDIVRADVPMRLHVTMAAFGFPLPVLIMSLTGLVIFAVGSFILLKRPQLIAARLVGLELVLIGFFFSMVYVQRDVGASWFSLMRSVMYAASFALIFPVSRHAAAYFPRELPSLLTPWWSVRLLYALAAAVIVGGIVIILLPLQEPVKQLIYFVGGTAILGWTSIVLFWITRAQRTPDYRRMSRAIKNGKRIAIGGMILFSLVFALMRWEGLYGFVGLPLLAIPFSYLYVIGRYRLLDMQLRIRRNVQWGFVSALWGLFTLAVLCLLLVYLVSIDFGLPQVTIRGLSVEVDPGHSSSAGMPARGLSVLVGIAVFVVVRAVRNAGQTYIDRTFYREPTDYTRAVTALAEVLSKRVSMMELGRGMVLRLADILHLKQAGVLFFREDGECCCHEAVGVSDESWALTCGTNDRVLAGQLSKLTGESRVEYLPPALKERFQAGGFRFIIPIRSKERMIGVLLLGEKQSEAAYSSGELEFLSAAARQSSVAIENAFLYEELAEKERMETELQIARRIQLASLPQRDPALKSFDVAGISIPAMEVGGDFYDYLVEGERRFTVIVGDVSGKGTSAALYMSKVQGILRSLHEFRLSPGEMFVRTNRLLAADMAKNSFVTAVGARFSAASRSVTVARAGHLPVYVYRAATGAVEKLTPRGLGLALDENRKFVKQLRQQRVRFSPGDLFLFVSDGVTETHDAHGEEYGEARLNSVLRASPGRPAAAIRDAILADQEKFLNGREREDDSTVVVVRILGGRRIA
jgi:serine phosphatase RsbU (regulator of sigma subunit)